MATSMESFATALMMSSGWSALGSGLRKFPKPMRPTRSEEHTSELQSQSNLVCRLLLEKKKTDPSPQAVSQARHYLQYPHGHEYTHRRRRPAYHQSDPPHTVLN